MSSMGSGGGNSMKDLRSQLSKSGSSAGGRKSLFSPIRSFLSRYTPGFLSKSIGKMTTKQWFDIAFYSSAVYTMFYYG